MTIYPAQVEAADAAARDAEARAGIHIRELAELPDLAAACALFDQIWQPGPDGDSALHAELLRALTKAGNYASGAYDEATGDLIGACMGFFGPPAEASLHSHIAAVLPAGLAPRGGLRAEAPPAGLVPAPRRAHGALDVRPADPPERLLQHGQARCPASRVPA